MNADSSKTSAEMRSSEGLFSGKALREGGGGDEKTLTNRGESAFVMQKAWYLIHNFRCPE